METPLGPTIHAVRTCTEKHRNYHTLKKQCRDLQHSLDDELDILKEADEWFQQENTSKNSYDAESISRNSPLLKGPVRNLESAIAIVTAIFETCSSSKRLKAYISRSTYPGQLVQAKSDIRKAVDLIQRVYLSMPGYQTKDPTPIDFNSWFCEEREKDQNNMYDRIMTLLKESNIVSDQQDFETQATDLQKGKGAKRLPMVWQMLCDKELLDRCIGRDMRKARLTVYQSVTDPKQRADALFRQGLMYSKGLLGITQNRAEALHYFQLAAERNSADAQYTLGSLLYYGKWDSGGWPDPAKALDFFRRAANQKHADAQDMMGRMYFNGEGGLQRDFTKSLECFQAAAAQQHHSARQHARRVFVLRLMRFDLFLMLLDWILGIFLSNCLCMGVLVPDFDHFRLIADEPGKGGRDPTRYSIIPHKQHVA